MENDVIERQDSDLYFNGYITQFSNGDKILERDLIEYTPQQPDLYHLVQQGDTITYLAWRYYQNITENANKYWKYIADANNIENPLDLSEMIGREILIPHFDYIKMIES